MVELINQINNSINNNKQKNVNDTEIIYTSSFIRNKVFYLITINN